MKKITTLLLLLIVAAGIRAQQKDYPIQSIPFTDVKFTDTFWWNRIKTNHTVTIPASFERCENTGRVKNFEMAASKSGAFCTQFPFDDTDIYKTLEGASYSMTLFPDKKMNSYMDSLIEKVRKAQEPDGYLYTARTIDPLHPHVWAGKERWGRERELSHELYNSGHLYEAAAAHYKATGKRNLLDIALKNADLVCSVFGPDKKHVAPGHEVVEMGLVKLYRITGNQNYLATAKYFLEERGHFAGYDSTSKDEWKNGSYWQDHIPVVEQTEAMGHAVRAMYLYAAMADIAALTGDQKFLRAIDTLWNNVVGKKMYVQGGIGSIGNGERFGDNYFLPNATAYNETCAAIGDVYWNHRMFLLHGDAKYIDVLEKVLYNGLISGVGMDGKSFFYKNAMQIENNHPQDVERSRSGWFPCSCCPTNIVRLLPSVPGYVYAQQGSKVYVNLFVSGTGKLNVNKKQLTVEQKNNYPWDGNLTFNITPQGTMDFAFLIRIPGWAQNVAIPSDLYSFVSPAQKKIDIRVNGKSISFAVDKGYAVLQRTWKKGDVVTVDLPMAVNKVTANANVVNDNGKVALQRGPLMYCAEWVDNNNLTSNIIIPSSTTFTTQFKSDMLNGVTVLNGLALAVTINPGENNVSTVKQNFTAIPYYAWAHRGEGEMTIWFPTRVERVALLPEKTALPEE